MTDRGSIKGLQNGVWSGKGDGDNGRTMAREQKGNWTEGGMRIGGVTDGVISCGSSDLEEDRRNRKG